MMAKTKVESKPMEHVYRKMVIIIENDTVGDALWMPKVAETLREYARATEQGFMGHSSPEIMETENGNKLTVLCGTYATESLIDKGYDRSGIHSPKMLTDKHQSVDASDYR